MNSLIASFQKIRLVIFDMDGVLTDGKLMIFGKSDWIRKMDIKDGYAIQNAMKNGLKISVVSGSSSEAVKERMAKLGVDSFHENISDKGSKVKEIIELNFLSKDEVAFVGDDIPDISAFCEVGVRACPADAATEVKGMADYISGFEGGNGCVRDILEKILRVKGLWNVGVDISSI